MITCCPKCNHIFKGKGPCPNCKWDGTFKRELKVEDLNGEKRNEIFYPKIDSQQH